MCKGFCRIFNISLHRIAYFSLVSSDVSSDCEQTTKNWRTYRKPKILIRYQVKFLVFYMFSGFLLFGHNLSRTQNYNSLTQQTTKLEKQPTVCSLQPTVHCAVHILIFKKNRKMFLKLKFKPAHKITTLQLNKQESQENSPLCAVYSPLCTVQCTS